jgi:sodium/bile acid cotransporter 3/5
VVAPVALGLALRRCTPRVLPQLDKAIQPVSLLVVMVAVTVSIYNFMEKWPLVTWDLMLATTCVPVICLLLSSTACLVFKQKIPQLKTVAMVTALQNTLLTNALMQASFPVEVSSVMAVTTACLDMASLGILFLLYLMHIVLWVTWPVYRMNHDNIGISGISKSFSERLVRFVILQVVY